MTSWKDKKTGPCSVMASTSHLHCEGGVRIPHVSTMIVLLQQDAGVLVLRFKKTAFLLSLNETVMIYVRNRVF